MAKKVTSNKTTSSKVASKASEVLKNTSTGKDSKIAAGSALSQTKDSSKTTSQKAATSASKVLKDGRTSSNSKSVAGSTLSQKEGKTKTNVKGTGPRNK